MRPKLRNLLLRTIYRALYPWARLWWRIRRPFAEGVAVVVRAGDVILVVRQSFRPGLGLVGGGRHEDEQLRDAAARELAEEVSLALPAQDFVPLGSQRLVFESRDLLVHLFGVELTECPEVRPDGAEVIAALWMRPSELRGRRDLHPVLADWLGPD